MPTRFGGQTQNAAKNVTWVWQCYACSSCGGVVMTSSHSAGGPIVEMYPSTLSVDEAIPPRARAFLDQAISSAHAAAGAVMLAASSVDAMLKAKGYTDGSLYSRIEKAQKDHLITDEMSTWAHEVRLDANDQRHADDAADLPTEDDAKKVIAFARALAEFLFVLPARVSRGRSQTA
jgi:hypothetical protein